MSEIKDMYDTHYRSKEEIQYREDKFRGDSLIRQWKEKLQRAFQCGSPSVDIMIVCEMTSGSIKYAMERMSSQTGVTTTKISEHGLSYVRITYTAK
tara:strand:- start:4550 stop:4837 length:288 start_codon:yes stop_codon:yes gene_type:complete